MRYTVAVDFDGVLHRYDTPWVAADCIPDEPVEGAIAWLNEIAQKFDVVIFTTRANDPNGISAMLAWLARNGASDQVIDSASFRPKPPALVYIDDRAFRFEGQFPSAQEIHALRPWHRPKAGAA